MPLLHSLLALSVMAAWGYNFVIIAYGLEVFPPLFLSALRFACAGLPLLFIWRHPPAPWRWMISLALSLGVIKFGLAFLGMALGAQAGLTSLILQVQAFFTVLFAILFLGERPVIRQYCGMALAFFGLSLIMIEKNDSSSVFIGILCIISGAVFWGLSNIIMKKAQSPRPLHLMIWISALSTPFLFLLSFFFEAEAIAQIQWAEITAKTYFSLGYLSFVATLIGFGIWTWLLRQYEAAQVAPFSLMVPIFGLASAHIFLNEIITETTLIAACFILAGLCLNTFSSLSFRSRKSPAS